MYKRITPKLWKNNEAIAAVFFLLPFIAGFLVFNLIPMLTALVISFVNLNSLKGFNEPGSLRFAGLSNYIKVLKDEMARESFLNSFRYTLTYLPFLHIVSIALALVMKSGIRFKVACRTMFFMPYVSNVVAISMLWSVILNPFDGPVNSFLKLIGISNPPMWLGGLETALPTAALIHVWTAVAFYMTVYLAALNNVPREIYEAADIDGASKWQQSIRISLPMISPTMFFLFITSIINSFQNYALIRNLTNGGPGTASRVAVINIYEEAFVNSRFSVASAQAILLFVIILIITIIQWKGQKKWVHY